MMLRDVLLDSHGWFQINSQLHTHLNLPKEQSVFVFKGLGQAVYDVVYGTALFNAHKKSVAFVRGNANCFEPLLPTFYKLAYNVQPVRVSQISSPVDWVQTLKADTVFVVLAEDHPITGELNPYVDEIDALLNQKRIFTIRISHHSHSEHKIEVNPYTVRICALAENYAVAFCGARFKAPMPTAPMMSWSNEGSEILTLLREQKELSKSLIEKRAHDLPSTYKRLPLEGNVLHDRLLISSNQVSADRVLALFNRMSGLQLVAESTQPCHSHLWNHYSQWWDKVPSSETLRGLLILPLAALENDSHWRHFHQAVQKALDTSAWE